VAFAASEVIVAASVLGWGDAVDLVLGNVDDVGSGWRDRLLGVRRGGFERRFRGLGGGVVDPGWGRVVRVDSVGHLFESERVGGKFVICKKSSTNTYKQRV